MTEHGTILLIGFGLAVVLIVTISVARRLAIKATPLTAALAGVWTAVGMTTFNAIMTGRDFDRLTHNLIMISAGLIFFYVPVFVLVFGPQNSRLNIRYHFTAEYWRRDFPQGCIRGLCWFLAGGVSLIVYSY